MTPRSRCFSEDRYLLSSWQQLWGWGAQLQTAKPLAQQRTRRSSDACPSSGILPTRKHSVSGARLNNQEKRLFPRFPNTGLRDGGGGLLATATEFVCGLLSLSYFDMFRSHFVCLTSLQVRIPFPCVRMEVKVHGTLPPFQPILKIPSAKFQV